MTKTSGNLLRKKANDHWGRAGLETRTEQGGTTMAAEASILERVPEALSLSKSEAARMLGVSLRTVDRFIVPKRLPVQRLGRRALIPRGSFKIFSGPIIARKPIDNLAARL
jgi:excisionase family DNA binding protein